MVAAPPIGRIPVRRSSRAGRVRYVFRATNVSYEGDHPYGTTAWWTDPGSTVSQKRYRYTGKEKDEETGLAIHGKRYYVAWLARWTASDPVGLAGGINRFRYSSDNPINRLDRNGTKDSPFEEAGISVDTDNVANTPPPAHSNAEETSYAQHAWNALGVVTWDLAGGGIFLEVATRDGAAIAEETRSAIRGLMSSFLGKETPTSEGDLARARAIEFTLREGILIGIGVAEANASEVALDAELEALAATREAGATAPRLRQGLGSGRGRLDFDDDMLMTSQFDATVVDPRDACVAALADTVLRRKGIASSIDEVAVQLQAKAPPGDLPTLETLETVLQARGVATGVAQSGTVDDVVNELLQGRLVAASVTNAEGNAHAVLVEGVFDIAGARYVLVQNPDPAATLSGLLSVDVFDLSFRTAFLPIH